ncbi:MAG: class I SAM-dependent methyltransferase [Nitrospinae bacterium]|nr:class I SAM-dependent methyltransferase [Nitrospinota bacterium]
MYYADKLDSLKDIFGAADVSLEKDGISVDGRFYPVVDDVIVLLDDDRLPPSLRGSSGAGASGQGFAEDIQFTFGEEWKRFPEILPEHEAEFNDYFDLVDIPALKDARVADAGCGIGRWSHFIHSSCREIVLLDFSEAIFVARKNLKDAPNAIFFMADITNLPFRTGFADFIFSLGVLHHIPAPALDLVRGLSRFAPNMLIYLYYALDNRPFHYKAIFQVVDAVRRAVSGVRNHAFREAFTFFTTVFVYMPMVALGAALKPLGLSSKVPLYEGYTGKGFARIRQDVYDRFFTGIEQRFTRDQIYGLKDTFADVKISNRIPYWHFTVRKS